MVLFRLLNLVHLASDLAAVDVRQHFADLFLLDLEPIKLFSPFLRQELLPQLLFELHFDFWKHDFFVMLLRSPINAHLRVPKPVEVPLLLESVGVHLHQELVFVGKVLFGAHAVLVYKLRVGIVLNQRQVALIKSICVFLP